MKVCTRCKISKNSSEFYNDSSNRDNLSHQCKQCSRDYREKYLKESLLKANNKNETLLRELGGEFVEVEEYPKYMINSNAILISMHHKIFKVIKPVLNTYGYHTACLAAKTFNNTVKIHRLVAKAFISNPNKYSQVNHIDGNKTNNNINNLEWCSAQQNMQHSWDTGLNKGRAPVKIIDENGKIYKSFKDCAEKLKCSTHNVHSTIYGRSKTCKGLKLFKYQK